MMEWGRTIRKWYGRDEDQQLDISNDYIGYYTDNGNITAQHSHCCYFFPFTDKYFFKPLPPVGAGGGYIFSGRPSVPLSVRPSVIHVVVLCFRNISSICWQIFAKLLSLVHLGSEMNWLDFGVKRSKFSSRSRHDRMHPRFSCFHCISSIYW